MPRVPLALGAHGNVSVKSSPTGGYVASARYRQMDGRIIQRRGTGPSQGKARVALNRVLAALEASPASATAAITPASKLSSVVAVWHLKKAAETAAAKPNCLRAQTLEEYMRLLNREVLDRKGHDRELPGLGNLRLNELTVQVMETFLTALEVKHASQPRNVRAALAGPLNLAVRYGAIPASPLKLVESFHKPQREVYSMTAEQVPRFRELVSRFGHEPGKPGPRNSRQLHDFVEVNLALALRPGELLALHWDDISGLDTDKPMVAIRRTVVTAKSRGTKAQPETKNLSSMRDLSIPQFAAELLRRRKLLSEGPLVFPTRNGTVLATAQYQKWLRACVRGTEFFQVTPHALRRTTASLLLAANPASLFEVSRMLGHSSVSVTEKAYLSKSVTRPDLSSPIQELYT